MARINSGYLATFALALLASAQNRVPEPPARKPPPPPAGATPRTPDGKVDLSGVWVVSGSHTSARRPFLPACV